MSSILIIALTALVGLFTVAGIKIVLGSSPVFATSRLQRIIVGLGCIAVFLTSLLIIGRYGSSLPYWDQWDGEGWNVYRPFLRSELNPHELVAPHNEHRIFTTRLVHLTLLILNGQWDARLQMAVNAGIHIAFVFVLVALLHHACNRKGTVLLLSAGVLISTIPFGWENVLSGFQTQFYLLLLYSLLCIGGNSRFESASHSGIATGAGLLCLVSMGSGLLTPLACGCAHVIAATVEWRVNRRRLIAFCLQACIFGVGILIHRSVPWHEPLKAQSLLAFAKTAGYAASWPFPSPVGFLLIWTPWVYDMIVNVRKREISHGTYFILTLGIWIIGQCLAIAYSRGGDGITPPSRYLDILALGIVTNVASCVRIGAGSLAKRITASSWATAILAALIVFSARDARQGCKERGDYLAIQASNVREYLDSHKAEAIYNKPFLHIPFPEAEKLEMYLSDPAIRSILPPPWRPPVIDFKTATLESTGISLSNIPPALPQLQTAPALGTFSSAAPLSPPNNRGWVSHDFPALRSGWLLWEVAGYPSAGGDAVIIEAPGKHRKLSFPADPGEGWNSFISNAPTQEWRLALNQTAGQNWFAIRGPWNVGPLSAVLRLILSATDMLLLVAITLSLCIPCVHFFMRRRRHVSEAKQDEELAISR